MSPYIESLLSSRLHFFTGKGGVGKSTVTWATARSLKAMGRRVLVASWNPYGAETHSQFSGVDVPWLGLDTMHCFREYALKVIKFERLYDTVFDNAVLKAFIQTAPGVSDGVIAGKMWDLCQHDDYDHVLVDLPASGHAISFFNSPIGIRKVFRFGFIRRHAEMILEYFQSEATKIHFVTIPEELPITETNELKSKLDENIKPHYGYLILNQVTPQFNLPPRNQIPECGLEAYLDYEDKLEKEKEARKDLVKINLPIIEIPRVAIRNTEGLLTTVSQNLESSR